MAYGKYSQQQYYNSRYEYVRICHSAILKSRACRPTGVRTYFCGLLIARAVVQVMDRAEGIWRCG